MNASKTKILFMDDESSIREIAKEYFLEFGYEITAVKDGLEALTAYRRALKAGSPYHIAVLDIVIPGGMGGIETMQNLSELNPDIRGIAISGYTEPVETRYKQSRFRKFMAKPFTMVQLHEAIDEVMKGEPD